MQNIRFLILAPVQSIVPVAVCTNKELLDRFKEQWRRKIIAESKWNSRTSATRWPTFPTSRKFPTKTYLLHLLEAPFGWLSLGVPARLKDVDVSFLDCKKSDLPNVRQLCCFAGSSVFLNENTRSDNQSASCSSLKWRFRLELGRGQICK